MYFPLNIADRVSVLDGSENSLLLMSGFAETSAVDGQPVLVRVSGLSSLFSGLTPGVLYFCSSSGSLIPITAIPASALCRSAGGALNPTTLLIERGVVIQRGSTMSQSPAAIDNSTGAIVVNTTTSNIRTGVAGVMINPFTALWLDQPSGNVLMPLDGTLAHVQKFVGVSDGGTYAAAATVTYAPPGGALTGFTGLTAGDYFAKDTDGSLVAFSAIGALTYTRLVLDAQTDTTGVVVDGPIEQHG